MIAWAGFTVGPKLAFDYRITARVLFPKNKHL